MPGKWLPHPRFAGLEVRSLGGGPGFEASELRVPPGGRIPDHIHETEWDLSYIVTGRGLHHQGSPPGETLTECRRQTWVAVPPGVVHGLVNTGRSPLVFYLLKHAQPGRPER